MSLILEEAFRSLGVAALSKSFNNIFPLYVIFDFDFKLKIFNARLVEATSGSAFDYS